MGTADPLSRALGISPACKDHWKHKLREIKRLTDPNETWLWGCIIPSASWGSMRWSLPILRGNWHNTHHHHHHHVYSPGRVKLGSSAANQSSGQLPHTGSSWWNGLWWSRRQVGTLSWPCPIALGWADMPGDSTDPKENNFVSSIIFGFPPGLKRGGWISLNFLPALPGKSPQINEHEILDISNWTF